MDISCLAKQNDRLILRTSRPKEYHYNSFVNFQSNVNLCSCQENWSNQNNIRDLRNKFVVAIRNQYYEVINLVRAQVFPKN